MEKGAKRALEKGKAKRTIAEMAGLTQEEIRLGFADQFSRIREETATLSMQGKILEEAKKRNVAGAPSSDYKFANQAKEQEILSRQEQFHPISDKPQMWSAGLKENLQKVMEVAREMDKSGNLSTARQECILVRKLTREAKNILETDPDKAESTEAYFFWDKRFFEGQFPKDAKGKSPATALEKLTALDDVAHMFKGESRILPMGWR